MTYEEFQEWMNGIWDDARQNPPSPEESARFWRESAQRHLEEFIVSVGASVPDARAAAKALTQGSDES